MSEAGNGFGMVGKEGVWITIGRTVPLLVANKPSGVLAVPGRGADKQDCLSARVQARYPDALIVHRLDMATSGLMVMARGPAAQRELSKAFALRGVKKAIHRGRGRPSGSAAGRLGPIGPCGSLITS